MLPVRVFQNRIDDFFPKVVSSLAHWPGGFDGLVDGLFSGPTCTGFPVDARQEGENLVVEAELPGISKDNLEITVENQVLSIAAEYKGENDQEKEGYHLRERRQGKCSRSFKLPTTADAEQVTADLSNGLLTIRIPTKEEAKPRRIEVK